MSTRVMMSLLAAALIGAAATSILGCADILGADFNRSFADGGGSSVSTSSGAGSGGSGAGTSTSGGTSTSTGTGTPACHLGSTDSLADTIDVAVWAKDVAVPGAGAADFFTSTPNVLQPALGYPNPVAVYKLYAETDMENRVALFQCSTEGHHMTLEPKGECTCMGYAVRVLGSSPPTGTNYVRLTRIVGKLPESTAFIPDEPTTTAKTCEVYGSKSAAPPTGCVATDMLYGAK